MKPTLSAEEVLTHIKSIDQKGESLNKKKVKQSHPELMQNALYYYPSWEHAIRETGLEL